MKKEPASIPFLNQFRIYTDTLDHLKGEDKLLISTLNAYSLILSQKDPLFRQALSQSDVLIPDGISIVMASWFIDGYKFPKIAGIDLFYFEMARLNKLKGTCFFLGSTEAVLEKISHKVGLEFPEVACETYSPPFRNQFTDEDNKAMITAINKVSPDVLFIG